MSVDPNANSSENITIRQLVPGKHLTILAAQTTVPFTNGQFESAARKLKAFFGVEVLQKVFAAEVQNLGPSLTVFLQTEQKADTPASPPIAEAASDEPAPQAVDVPPEESPTAETPAAVPEPVAPEPAAAVPDTPTLVVAEMPAAVPETPAPVTQAPPVAGAPTPSVDPV